MGTESQTVAVHKEAQIRFDNSKHGCVLTALRVEPPEFLAGFGLASDTIPVDGCPLTWPRHAQLCVFLKTPAPAPAPKDEAEPDAAPASIEVTIELDTDRSLTPCGMTNCKHCGV